MINKNKDAIIQACSNAIKRFDFSCKGFWNSASKDELHSKIAFIELINRFRHLDSMNIFAQLYQFYAAQNAASRVTYQIKNILMWILDIKQPEITLHAARIVNDHIRIQSEISEKAEAIIKDAGLNKQTAFSLHIKQD